MSTVHWSNELTQNAVFSCWMQFFSSANREKNISLAIFEFIFFPPFAWWISFLPIWHYYLLFKILSNVKTENQYKKWVYTSNKNRATCSCSVGGAEKMFHNSVEWNKIGLNWLHATHLRWKSMVSKLKKIYI